MSGTVNIGGVQKNISSISTNIGGVWKPVTKLSCNIAGVWKDGWTSGIGGIDSYCKTMLHMNGANASTSFVDSELTPKVWTNHGSAQISTAQSKFGGASGLFSSATSDYIDTPDHSDFTVGNGDFEIDFCIKRSALSSTQYIISQSSSGGSNTNTSFRVWLASNNTIVFTVCSGSVQYNAQSLGTISDTTTWHHVACVRNGNTLKIYIDGALDGTKDVTGITVNDSAYKVAIGTDGGNLTGYLNAYIDEFRFSKGIARWTSNFTPPTSEYTT